MPPYRGLGVPGVVWALAGPPWIFRACWCVGLLVDGGESWFWCDDLLGWSDQKVRWRPANRPQLEPGGSDKWESPRAHAFAKGSTMSVKAHQRDNGSAGFSGDGTYRTAATMPLQWSK